MPSHWNAKLRLQITLKSGEKLTTLRDGADVLQNYFGNVIESASLAKAIRLLLQAAETGNRKDIEAAREQLCIVLRGRWLME